MACVEGDDVTRQINAGTALHDRDGTVRDIGLPVVGANAYLGADALLPALKAGADVIIAGRIADPSLFVAPLAFRLLSIVGYSSLCAQGGWP